MRITDLKIARRRSRTAEFVLWRLVSPQGAESCRWECVDGRWVALTLGHGDEIGSVIVTDGEGLRSRVESYEEALALARSLRT